METPAGLDQLCINTVRTLAMDAVQQAESGHPGTAMALAPLAYVLWQRHLRYNPANPGDAALENAIGMTWLVLGVSVFCLAVCIHALHVSG